MCKSLFRKCLAVLIVGLVGLVFQAEGAFATSDPVAVPSGGARATTAADLAPARGSTGSFNERWSYVILLEGGTQLVINFGTARLSGLREPTVGADLSVLGFEGSDYFVAREYPVASRFRWEAGAARLEAHPTIFFEGAPPQRHRVHFATEKDGVDYAIDLTFSDMAPGMSWGDGVFRLGGETITMAILIPRARVSGTVRINDTERRVCGTAYMDRTTQTTYAPRLTRSAVRLVRHAGSGFEVGYYILPASRFDDRVVGFGVRQAGGRATLMQPARAEVVNTRRALGLDVPGQVRVAFADGSETIFNRRRDRQAFGAFDELGRVERFAARRFIGGEPVHFRGMGTIHAGESSFYDLLVIR